jgi:5'-nucleotidase/UDP-sugar diphosphatase
MRDLVKVFQDEIGPRQQEVVGFAAENLCFERIPGQGRSVICDVCATFEQGSDISQAVTASFLDALPSADLALQNAGGVRTDIRAGNVTYGDAYNLLPFGNVLVTLPITGAQLKEMLEAAIQFSLVESDGAYPYVSGLRFDVDASAPEGRKVSNLEVNPRLSGEWTALDVSLDTATTYTLVTNDYSAQGKDGYDILGSLPATNSFLDYVEAFLRFLPLSYFPLVCWGGLFVR